MTAARKKPAKKVSRPRPRVTGSLADQINNLKVGESVASAARYGLEDGSWAPNSEDIREALTKLRSNLAAYVARITDEVDVRSFRVESGTYLTDAKDAIIATAVVTRVE